MQWDTSDIRKAFPALDGGAIYFDNPGGTQVPRTVLDRMQRYLIESNANHGGAFPTSRASDEILDLAHQALADFLRAAGPDEVIFGPNMTSLTFSISRSLSRSWQKDDEIIVTRLDHDANISPWLLAAQDRGCRVRWLDFDVEDCTLQLDDLDHLLSKRTRLVAVGYASNAVGTINPVAEITRRAHQAGALCYVDAVQFAPHGPIDVQAVGCDFLAVSAYKFFGPHLGALYGRLDLLQQLTAYKVRPAPDQPPGKFETGTQNHEGIAGTLGALEYLAALGRKYGGDFSESYSGRLSGQALDLKLAMHAIRSHEIELSRLLLETLSTIPGLRIYGLTDQAHLDRRVPTVSFTLAGYSPRQVAERLAHDRIYVWDGNYYALAVTERLGLEQSGGMIRVGLAHYNTQAEIDALDYSLRQMIA
jgi:cysteine desulfurase family protein (TIGR01976 family)